MSRPVRASLSGSIATGCSRTAQARFATGTALVDYGDGDWDDTLQPADPAMRTRMVSAWTVALAYQTFRQLPELCRRAGQAPRASRLEALLERMRADFHAYLMPGGIVAGFLVREEAGMRGARYFIRRIPTTGIRYRLLPMTRAVLAELFTPDEARRHLDIVARELRFPDGVRLMSEPATYHGGRERLFKRADTAANVGPRDRPAVRARPSAIRARRWPRWATPTRSGGLCKCATRWACRRSCRTPPPRQSNVYFSSSDADFGDRLEAAARWSELRTGGVAVRGGWRLYSSGPGLFLHTVRGCLLGVRETFGDVVFDPVLPHSLDGLRATLTLFGRVVELRYRVRRGNVAPSAIVVNGVPLPLTRREGNPYRPGGWRVPVGDLDAAAGRRQGRGRGLAVTFSTRVSPPTPVFG